MLVCEVLGQDYAEGSEVRMGQHRFICISALGRGSYGEVWRAKASANPSHGLVKGFNMLQ